MFKDYANQAEIEETLALLYAGVRANKMADDWRERGNLTAEEEESLRLIKEHSIKFYQSYVKRLSPKENSKFLKRVNGSDFKTGNILKLKVVDQYQLEKLTREVVDRDDVVLPKDTFYTFLEEIEDIRCANCTIHHESCELYDMLDKSNAPEPGADEFNCKYSYPKNITNEAI